MTDMFDRRTQDDEATIRAQIEDIEAFVRQLGFEPRYDFDVEARIQELASRGRRPDTPEAAEREELSRHAQLARAFGRLGQRR